jgi:hypothetical protein
MKHLTLVTLFALFTNAAWADAQNNGLPADYYHGAAACDADVAIAPATPPLQVVAASQTKIALDSQPVAVNCTITPHAGVCSEQD